jgi:hypothetical protein
MSWIGWLLVLKENLPRTLSKSASFSAARNASASLTLALPAAETRRFAVS